jgi:thiopurine S-methyltransferase
MNTDFWLARWAKHEIGFHQQHVNGYLREYWPQLQIPQGGTVFVPLCGKSLDMRWLRERGYRVLGIEIARNACSEFFEEWKVTPAVTTTAKFERWKAQGVTLLCGDFFALEEGDLPQVDAVFDRAALVALPPPMRRTYAAKLREILPAHVPILLVAPDYDQLEMKGPPFAVPRSEIHELFAGCEIDELAAVDVTGAPENARFRQRGLTKLMERVFRIEYVDRN